MSSQRPERTTATRPSVAKTTESAPKAPATIKFAATASEAAARPMPADRLVPSALISPGNLVGVCVRSFQIDGQWQCGTRSSERDLEFWLWHQCSWEFASFCAWLGGGRAIFGIFALFGCSHFVVHGMHGGFILRHDYLASISRLGVLV